MEGTMRTTAKRTDESYAPRKLTQDERLMVACVVVALLACLAVGYAVFVSPAVSAGALAGV